MKQNNSEIIAVSSIIAEVMLLLGCWDGREAEVLSPTAHPNFCSSTERDTPHLVWAPTKAVNKVSSSPAIITFCSALGVLTKSRVCSTAYT